ncbi:MAG TPA: hypothetical protein VL337_02860 [Acidimicrobiales bacterium]|jgi:hypothetical protein|nr:hypothetical protein [Acidimicrobiales bacterium]
MATASLTIDYSNGSTKSFTTIPWTSGLTILDALEAAQSTPPGLAMESGSDRIGALMVHKLDGMPDGGDGAWRFWVGARPGPERLGTKTSFGFRPESRAANEVGSGEHIVAKLVVPTAEDA